MAPVMWLLLAVLTLLLPANPAHAQGMTRDALNRLADEFTNLFFTEQIGPRVQDNVPLVASSTAFAFRWNSDLDVWERVALTTGPIFLERPEPLGKGHFDVNVSYGWVRFSELNGRSLYSGLTKLDPTNRTLFTFRVRTAEVQLVSFAASYGVTDDIDVSLIIPVERVAFSAQFLLNPPIGSFARSDPTRRDHVGIGDITLRSKYRFLKSDLIDAAAGLELDLPSGDPDKGLGLGDTRLIPALYLAKVFAGVIEPHLNVSVETNLDELDDSRLGYGGGLTWQAIATRSGFVRSFDVTVDIIGRADLAPPDQRRRGSFFGTARQEHIVDVAPGFKVALMQSLVIFAAVEVPLNDDGLRPDFVPVGGIEAVF
jgi:hypothetical protein